MFDIPAFQEYPLSSKFGPVNGLPSQKKHAVKILDNMVYKPRQVSLLYLTPKSKSGSLCIYECIGLSTCLTQCESRAVKGGYSCEFNNVFF